MSILTQQSSRPKVTDFKVQIERQKNVARRNVVMNNVLNECTRIRKQPDDTICIVAQGTVVTDFCYSNILMTDTGDTQSIDLFPMSKEAAQCNDSGRGVQVFVFRTQNF